MEEKTQKPFKINFNKNWNKKLDNDVFTTIRKLTPESLKYYEDNLNNVGDMLVDYKKYCQATLVSIEIKRFGDIDKTLIILDTGIKDIEEAIRTFALFGVYKNTPAIITTLVRKRR